ncbi:outer membrane beta-barrel protein [Aquimarina algiphila]|uniref:outer membrane beta-barrel protein n=1 Tax=Aquimarina algiphila TaxID=2047982 RepID=UPI00232C8164|nr:outer membrane beta-barrel protein [Aquimarina algiphila]
MKKLPLLLLLMILSVTGYAQIKFEKGYFIDNNGSKTECLIKNIDWHDNPTQIQYKITEDAKAKTGYIKNIKEFAVSDLRYIRVTIDIDRSSKDLKKLSDNKNPEFKEETLFLKHLVKGEANLYLYEDGNLRRYFYNVGDDNIQQLIYKVYRVSSIQIDKNNRYKQQLWTDVRCDNIEESEAAKTEYKRKSLIKYFTKYNTCIDPSFVNIQKREDRDLFNITIRPGIDFSSVSTDIEGATDFDNEIGLRFGVEAEFILPFNKNKWGIFIEPTYRSYTPEVVTQTTDFIGIINTTKLSLDYKSIELPIGLRHYFFLNDKSKLFVNAAYVVDFELDSSFTSQLNDGVERDIDLKTKSNIIIGFGFKYNDRYGIEARYGTNREIGGFYNYKSFSVILGYTLF